jgi:hypothetical protein
VVISGYISLGLKGLGKYGLERFRVTRFWSCIVGYKGF